MIATKKVLPLLALALTSVAAYAADYYVAPAPTGSDDNTGMSSVAPFATIDKAIATATSSSDVIHVEPGTYSTTTQYGPDLKAKLVGMGTSRSDVTIQSAGSYRTLRMAAGSWLENVMVVGEGAYKADKGGAIEMSGGTVTNCVVRDGTAKGNDSKNAGGNLYVNSDGALVVDCEISDGTAKCRGGNVCLDHGTLRKCTITGGATSGGSEQNDGGNVWIYQGTVEDCTISGGSAVLGGNVFVRNSVAAITGGTIAGGSASESGGNVYLQSGSLSGSTISNGATTSNNNSQGGGNIYAAGSAVITNCTISGGTAKNRGGSLFLLAATLVDSTLSGGSVVDNASGIGGNVFVNHADALVSGCTISGGNVAARGGNVFMLSGTLQDSSIENGVCSNPTDQYWGGANVFIQGGKISRCIAKGGSITGGQNLGGGISIQGDPAKVIEDTLVYGNANGGVYSAASNVQVWNCTIVDNAEFGFYRYGGTPTAFANCVLIGNKRSSDDSLANWSGTILTSARKLASDDSSRFSTLGDEFVVISESDFVDYTNGDYMPKSMSALVDEGVTDTREDASATDILGHPRVSSTVDIGCYEYQHQEMTVSFLRTGLANEYAPAVATFAAEVQNAQGEVSYMWSFGDGTTDAESGAVASHTYTTPGSYTVKVTATSSVGVADYTIENCVSIVSKTVYVTAGNAEAAFPYSTPETGYATLSAAVADAVDGSVILVGDGLYEQTAPIDVPKAVTIKGNDANPAAVILRNTATASSGNSNFNRRVMTVSDAGAWISGLTMENGNVYCNFGANLYVSAGVVSNCVVRGGNMLANESNNAGCGGGVALADSGIVTHCVITNNAVVGTASDQSTRSAAVCFRYGSSGKLLNSLVAYNSYAPSAETAKRGTAGIFYGGNNSAALVENCTVVGNTVVGSISDQSAGMYCNAYTTIRNTVFAGNSSSDGGSAAFLISGVTVVNCATDGASPLNDSCVVGATDEMFKDFANGNLTPKAKGTLFAKGATPAVVASVDLAGNPRVMFDKIDIGCYECQRKLGMAIILR